MHTQNHIVVGAGLAGCLLAWRLEQAGQHVTLIGSTQLPNASEVAGGVINPVTGRWMIKTWNFDALIPHAAATYRELEQQFSIELYHPIPLIRYCQHSIDAKRMSKRMRNPRYANVLGDSIPVGEGPDALEDTHGSFHIKQAAHVNLPLLLKTLRRYLAEKSIFRDETFIHADLSNAGSQWTYHDLKADHVIFSEGVGMQTNPWFNWLPLTPAKGETLILECPTLELPRAIYHHRKWLLPYGDHSYRLGATFDSADLTHEPTEAGARELLESARSFIAPQHTLKVKQHYAGLRPCTKDFRPFIGDHPTEAGLHIFNGLGSKGASLAPELIRQFLAHLLEGEALDPEIDIARHIDDATNPTHTDATC
jgi:glycine/D-amino acid oxidase-like deaminating enzyme